MTFTDIKGAIKDYCGLSSAEADTRVGKAVNRHYRRVTASIGMDTSRFVTRTMTTTNGVQTVTFSNIEKIDRLLDTTSGTTLLQEVSIHELRSLTPSASAPVRWALQATEADSVVVRLDTSPQSTYTLQADGWATLADLSGTDEPVFPESYHDILVWYVISEELLKKEKDKLAAQYQIKAASLLADLRFFLQDSPTRLTQQGSALATPLSGSTGGGSGTLGSTAYTQSALVTYDRGAGLTPFAVAQSDAPYVANLGAEFLGNVTTDRLIGRDTAGTGESEQLTVSGGLEFTSSGGIQRSALSGDVSASGGSNVTSIGNLKVVTAMINDLAVTTGKINDLAVTTGKIAADAVTYAKIQNVSAISKLLGRGAAAGAGDAEEITLGANLAMAATTVGVTAPGSDTQVLYNNGGVLGGAAGLTWTSGSSLLTAPGALTLAGLFTLTNGQIVFPGTANPSSGVNTLDEYEEGTWTPADGSGAALSLTSVVAHYVKIGQCVHAWFTFTYPATADGSAAVISGFPFTSFTSTAHGAAAIGSTNYSALVAIFDMNSAATTAAFRTTGGAALLNSDLTTRIFSGVMVYRAAA